MDEDEAARAANAEKQHRTEQPTHVIRPTLKGWACTDCDAQWPWHGGSVTRQRLWDLYMRES